MGRSEIRPSLWRRVRSKRLLLLRRIRGNRQDLDILDLNNLVAYYCYTNRVANGLGLKTEIGTTREATLALPV